MIKNTVYSHDFYSENINPPRKEIVRYMVCKEESANEQKLINEFLPLVKKEAKPKGSYAFFDLEKNDDAVFIEKECLKSKALFKNLMCSDSAIVFSLTLGIGIDRLISKYSVLSPASALCINGIATALIEEYANVFCGEIKEILKGENLFLMPRFSPGYADFDLKNQELFIKLTNAQKICGINLTKSYMMAPSKSITAIMGVSDTNLSCNKSGCEICDNKNCKFRR